MNICYSTTKRFTYAIRNVSDRVRIFPYGKNCL
jgi:hypothetical protein